MKNENQENQNSNYRKFAIMLGTSFCIMYAVMFLNVEKADHIYLSLSRLYMSILMVAPMALLMLTMMKKMYKNKRLNTIISISSISVFVIALVLLRTQTPVGDKQYMKAMIPHHSSAILTSKHANITDPEVKELSEKIIKSQEEEISQMKAMLDRLEER